MLKVLLNAIVIYFVLLMHDAYLCREWFLKEKCVLLKFYAILLVFTLEEHVEKTTNLNCRNVNFLQHKKWSVSF